MEYHLERIRDHIKILNHSSERMATELGDITERVAAIEAHMGWVMKLIWLVLGGVIAIVFKVWIPNP